MKFRKYVIAEDQEKARREFDPYEPMILIDETKTSILIDERKTSQPERLNPETSKEDAIV